MLKGALALNVRFGNGTRTTRDLDLGRYDDEDATNLDFKAAQALDLGDFFTFVFTRTSRLDVALEGAAIRYHATAELDGRRFDDVIIDVGFSDSDTHHDTIALPAVLSFAGFAAIEVPVIALEQHVAEKLHAYAKSYGGDRPSSRVKDLIDLVLIRAFTSFEAKRLRQALSSTFVERGVHDLPTSLPLPPTHWPAPYRQMADEVGIDPDIATGHRLVAAFLDPVLQNAVPDDAVWDPKRGSW